MRKLIQKNKQRYKYRGALIGQVDNKKTKRKRPREPQKLGKEGKARDNDVKIEQRKLSCSICLRKQCATQIIGEIQK